MAKLEDIRKLLTTADEGVGGWNKRPAAPPKDQTKTEAPKGGKADWSVLFGQEKDAMNQFINPKAGLAQSNEFANFAAGMAGAPPANVNQANQKTTPSTGAPTTKAPVYRDEQGNIVEQYRSGKGRDVLAGMRLGGMMGQKYSSPYAQLGAVLGGAIKGLITGNLAGEMEYKEDLQEYYAETESQYKLERLKIENDNKETSLAGARIRNGIQAFKLTNMQNEAERTQYFDNLSMLITQLDSPTAYFQTEAQRESAKMLLANKLGEYYDKGAPELKPANLGTMNYEQLRNLALSISYNPAGTKVQNGDFQMAVNRLGQAVFIRTANGTIVGADEVLKKDKERVEKEIEQIKKGAVASIGAQTIGDLWLQAGEMAKKLTPNQGEKSAFRTRLTSELYKGLLAEKAGDEALDSNITYVASVSPDGQLVTDTMKVRDYLTIRRGAIGQLDRITKQATEEGSEEGGIYRDPDKNFVSNIVDTSGITFPTGAAGKTQRENVSKIATTYLQDLDNFQSENLGSVFQTRMSALDEDIRAAKTPQERNSLQQTKLVLNSYYNTYLAPITIPAGNISPAAYVDAHNRLSARKRQGIFTPLGQDSPEDLLVKLNDKVAANFRPLNEDYKHNLGGTETRILAQDAVWQGRYIRRPAGKNLYQWTSIASPEVAKYLDSVWSDPQIFNPLIKGRTKAITLPDGKELSFSKVNERYIAFLEYEQR